MVSIIMRSLKLSETNNQKDIEGTPYWIKATGIKSFSSFSKKFKHVVITYLSTESNYCVYCEKRFSNGYYCINADEAEKRIKTYEGRPSPETIVGYVMKALEVE